MNTNATTTSREEYWRSLEERARTPEFQERLAREFPAGASEWADDVSRRNFLKLMGASMALAGLTSCTRQPIEQIVPYVRQPEEIIPGKPLYFATAMPFNGYALGLLARSNEGRPTKLEGNPDHPASLGATNVFGQAAILDLYDPDRSRTVTNAGEAGSWELCLGALTDALREQRAKRGAGLRLLTETVTSPTLAAQIEELLKQFPAAKWHQYQPVNRDNVHEGARLAFGEVAETRHFFDQARVIVSLDSDFLFAHPESLRYARQFAQGRRVSRERAEMNRLYQIESTPTITGTMADHRLPMKASAIQETARALMGSPASNPLAAIVRDLQQNRGSSIVIAGGQQPPAVHALVHQLNERLGNVGKTLVHTASAEARPVNQLQSLRELAEAMASGAVDLLVMLGGNPVYTAPADVPFAEQLSKVKLRLHLGSHTDETAAYCHWHVPESHFLESWGDLRAFDGTVSIVQPLLAPLYASKSAHELLDAMLRHPGRTGYEIVRDYWRSRMPGGNFEQAWRKALHDGVIRGTESPPRSVKARTELPPSANSGGASPGGLELCFRPDNSLWDGRFANNGWLQELPKPITKLTWDNAALISPTLAERVHVANGDVLRLRFHGRELDAPAWITPGQAENSVTVHLGHGRTRVGRVGEGNGFNAGALRSTDAFWFGPGLELTRTDRRHVFASTQNMHHTQGRNIVRGGTLAQFQARPDFINEHDETPSPEDTLYHPEEFKTDDYAWGMAINLSTCIGCNACVIACQSENNIPVVGKDQVSRGRDMQWIRVDQYFQGTPENPTVSNQPVPCMHCENAPCELVCPVAATLHDHEGLNVQVYNRCVGTRYCSNNCPYKVRRFNFLTYNDYHDESLKAMRNPNVTVRWRGVMEKCTYCVQRISAARIDSKKEGRAIRDGEVIPACAQACPTETIVFGDLRNRESAVARAKSGPLNYSMLGELNTRPRTTYLARMRNPNAEVETI